MVGAIDTLRLAYSGQDDRLASPSKMELDVFMNGPLSLVDQGPARSSAPPRPNEGVALRGHDAAFWRVRVYPSPRSASNQTTEDHERGSFCQQCHHRLHFSDTNILIPRQRSQVHT